MGRRAWWATPRAWALRMIALMGWLVVASAGAGACAPAATGGGPAATGPADAATEPADDAGSCPGAPGCEPEGRDGGEPTGPRADARPPGDREPEICDSQRFEAETVHGPADILWAVDSSGSMSEEADLVQENLNRFAADVTDSGVDFRVVVISSAGYVQVPDPLGSDSERYRFIDHPVGSNVAFEVLLDEFGAYEDFLRPDAAKHIVVVTDDESDMGRGTFRMRMESLLGGEFTFHAIASEDTEHGCDTIPFIGMVCEPGCEGPHGEAADVGAEYYALANDTMGTTFSICAPDWSSLFTTLQESVIGSTQLPCHFELPDTEGVDPSYVNVVYTGPEGAEQTIPSAMESQRCNEGGSPQRAWFYDEVEQPTMIVLCPAACDLVQATDGGSIDLALGCETEVLY